MGRPLVSTSVELIRRHQAPSGAYVAAPDFGTYGYSWLRDGAFIATALDTYGEHDSAYAFHLWVAETVMRHEAKVAALEAASESARTGTDDPLQPMDNRFVLHTRFTTDGWEGDEAWGNFQLDGYGFWLTSVAGHLGATQADSSPFVEAIGVVRRYLSLTWDLPCYDSWEEYPTRCHPVTLAAVARGLEATAELAPVDPARAVPRQAGRLLQEAAPNGVLLKFVPDGSGEPRELDPSPELAAAAAAGHERVGKRLPSDAIDGGSLLVLGRFGPFEPDAAVVGSTLERVREQLCVDGGVYRYLGDEYYGGGRWIVLAGALAEQLARRGQSGAPEVLEWIEAHADADGHLGEQVTTKLRNPELLRPWVQRWGAPASPLLWSHAMYLLGAAAVDGVHTMR